MKIQRKSQVELDAANEFMDIIDSVFSENMMFSDNLINVSSDFHRSVNESVKKNVWLQKDIGTASVDFQGSKTSSEPDAKEADELIRKSKDRLVLLIKTHSFDEGQLSSVDKEAEHILNRFGEDFLVRVIDKVWHHCYTSKNQMEHAHFLNLIKNLSFMVDCDRFVTYAISAFSHEDLLIREAAISTFESWDKYEYKKYLESVADSGIGWLDQYKREVIENLGQ